MSLKLSPYSLYDNSLEDIERKIRIFQILSSLKKENLNGRLQKTVEYVVKYFNAYFAIITSIALIVLEMSPIAFSMNSCSFCSSILLEVIFPCILLRCTK
jgi:hypothetical protein